MFNLFRKKIGILGYGNMGSAIAEGIKARYAVCVFDKERSKITGLNGITSADSSRELVERSQVIILAIKPQDFEPLLAEIKNSLKDKLVISIAAGITTVYIQKVLGVARVVRVMPNLAAMVGKSTTSICKGVFATSADLKFAERLFKYLGTVFIFPEDMIDAATAIAGSGPAYILYDMEINHVNPSSVSEDIKNEYIRKLNEAGIKVELTSKIASELAASTTASTISLSVQSARPPAVLRQMITSAGGTTEAAIKVISNGGSWSEAAIAAKKRAQELSRNTPR